MTTYRIPPMTDPTCAVPDCTRNVQARGWCSTHYGRWMKHGSTDKPVRVVHRTDVESRLRSHLQVAASGCWEWQGSRRLGYGRMGIGPKLYSTQSGSSISLAWFDNMTDAARKGRLSNPRRDDDNPHSTVKACADGIVDAGVVKDDNTACMRKEPTVILPPEPAARMWLEITTGPREVT